MRTTKFLAWIICLIIFALLSGLGWVTFMNWAVIKNDFFKINLLEVIKILLTITIPLLVTYYVSTQLNYNLKKRDVLINLIDAYRSQIRDLYLLVNDYMQTPDKTKHQTILIDFTTTSNFLNTLLDVQKETESQFQFNVTQDSIENAFLRFKQSVTDTPFGKDDAHYEDGRRLQIAATFADLEKKLIQCKLSLFR